MGCEGTACYSWIDCLAAGSCVWMVSSSSYPDYDGFEIYLTENGTAMPQPVPTYTVLQQAVINAQDAQFRNFDAALSCVQRRNQQPPNSGSWPYVDGWNTTLSVVRYVSLHGVMHGVMHAAAYSYHSSCWLATALNSSSSSSFMSGHTVLDTMEGLVMLYV